MTFPFARTTCACRQCVQCCKDQPGPLAPGDLERIAEYLGLPLPEAKTYFWASLGALVQSRETGVIRRVGTITPKWVRGKCVFLDDQDRCRIHAVAPAGCAYFDTHMMSQEGHRRAVHLVHAQDTAEYQQLRSELPLATRYKPRGY